MESEKVNFVVLGIDEAFCKYNTAIRCASWNACKTCGWDPKNKELHNKRVTKCVVDYHSHVDPVKWRADHAKQYPCNSEV